MESLTKIKVLSIDIGIINLGYVFANFNYSFDDYSRNNLKGLPRINEINGFIDILDTNNVDITNVRHSRVKYCDCKLYHDSCIPDYLDHFIQEHLEMFETAEIIIIERQPPIGITNVQDLLFTKFRSKVILISPRSIHKYFGMSKDYSIRKTQSEKISEEYLIPFKSFSTKVRKHDMSDAMLMLIYYFSLKFKDIGDNIPGSIIPILDFEQFRFIPE